MPQHSQTLSDGVLSAPGSRRALAGFSLAGLLVALPGGLLLSWGHHIESSYVTAGWYFFAAAFGMLAAVRLSVSLLAQKGTGFGLVTGCATASGALLALALASPPSPAWERVAGMAVLGLATGLLNSAIFEAIAPIYQHDSAATVNLGGAFFGAGCLAAPVLVSGTFYLYSVPAALFLLALIPAGFAWMYSRIAYRPVAPELRRPITAILSDLKSPSAMLLGTLLFFQFANEWTIAGWLALLLVQRLGISPQSSLGLLSLYWLLLFIGRFAVQSLLPHFKSRWFVAANMLTAMFGCMILALTTNRSGVIAGICLTAAGFAAIYPLVVQNVANRVPNYHPGLYNGIFSVPLAASLFAPGMLGLLAESTGPGIVMWLPFVGGILVLLLMAAIWVEARWGRYTT